MLSQTVAPLEAVLALKARQFKLAVRAYADDRAAQGKGIVVSYAVAASLFVVAGAFLIGAFAVGLMALYRWIALLYGQFVAFGCVGGLLVVMALICVGVAISQLHAQTKKVPSLSNRLVTAAKTSPLRLDQIKQSPARDSNDPHAGIGATPSHARQARHQSDGRLLLLAAVTLLGWTIARNRRRVER